MSREGETDKFKAKFKSLINNENENPPEKTHLELTPKQEIPKSSNSTSTLRVRDPSSMMDSIALIRFYKNFFDKKPKALPINGYGLKKAVCSGNRPLILVRGKASLREVENLYNRYFCKEVQDTIVIIANILNIISMSNKHHKARMDESFKKKTEAEKLKERCDANRMHARHKKILESRLKTHFANVITSFIETEFEPSFQMFFLSILTVLRVLDQPKFKKGSIFKNLVLLLWNSLKNSEFDHPKVFNMFRSKTFRPDCIDLISLIEDSRDSDPGITDRMALFFVSSVNSRDYFQTVIDAVTGDENDDLALLIDNAAKQCRINSRFNDPINYSPPSPICIQRINVSEAMSSVNSSKNKEEVVQQWVIANTNSLQ